MLEHVDADDILVLCHPLRNQLAWRFVAHRYLLQPDPEASRPLSVVGSLQGGGRYNIGRNLPEHKPFGAVYTSFEATTATQEMRFPTARETPYLLLPVRATLARVLDLRDTKTVQALELDQDRLHGEWRETSKILGQPAYPQLVGARLFRAGVEALLTVSVVDKGGTNLTIYPANLTGESRVSVTAGVDDSSVVDVLLPEDTQVE